VNVFTSLQSAAVQPSAFNALPDVCAVIAVAVRTSYFCPNFG